MECDDSGRMDLARAGAFVEANADPLDRARLRALLHGEPAPPEALPRANDDGGFPAFWSGDHSSLDATCAMLDRLSDLGDAAATLRARAILFVQARRRLDGWWEEDASLAAKAPPWAMPGDEAATVYATANCGYWCDNARAADWLAARVSPEGRLPSFVAAHWLAAALLRRHAQPAAFPLVRHLAGRVGELGPSALARLASTLPAEPVGAVARMLLSGRQQPDGRWSSEDGAACDAATTLAALRVLSP
jgi:hypothetical protein